MRVQLMKNRLPMFGNAQTVTQRREILDPVMHCSEAIVQNNSMRTGERAVDWSNGFLHQSKRKENEEI